MVDFGLLYEFSQQVSNLIATFLHFFKANAYSLSIYSYLKFFVSVSNACIHFRYFVPDRGIPIDIALLVSPHSSPPVVNSLLGGRVTYLTGKIGMEKLGMLSYLS